MMTSVITTGAKRSGTTLMLYLFDSVPNTFNFLDESYFLEYIYDIGKDRVPSFIELQKTADLDDLIKGTKIRYLFPFFDEGLNQNKGSVNEQSHGIGFDMKKLRRALEKRRRTLKGTVGSLWKMWQYSLMEAMGYDGKYTEAVFFKCPDYGRSAITALEYLRDPKIIIMLRNPLFAIDSLKRSRQLRNEKLVHLYELFNIINDYKFLERTIKEVTSDKKNSKDVALIRYEDLVSEPEKEMRRLADFIGIDFNEIMLRPTIKGRDWGGWSAFTTFNGISSKTLNRKIATLSDWEVGYIKDELKTFMKRYGYNK